MNFFEFVSNQRRTGRVVLALRAVLESELTSEDFSPDGYDLLVVLRA
jgi:hypothetical protein